MISYIGEECNVCREKFEENDDIVVCPECGTPYHRKCWKEKNGCINSALHESGGSWMSELMDKRRKAHSFRKACPECSFLNPMEAEKCRNCASDLAGRKCTEIDLADKNIVSIIIDSGSDYFALSSMEIMDRDSGITIAEMGDYAKVNKPYFMKAFRKIRRSASKLSVNLAALLFPDFYCVFRKMYFQAVLLFLFRFVLNIPLYLYYIAHLDPSSFMVSEQMRSDIADLVRSASVHSAGSFTMNLGIIFDIILRTVLCLNVNQLYFTHTIEILKKLKRQNTNYLLYRNDIKNTGGIDIGAVISMMFSKIVFICILLIILILRA